MNYDFLSDTELLQLVLTENLGDKLVHTLAERLEMRLRDIEDLRSEVNDLEQELDDRMYSLGE
jgi:DNA repair protein RadC